MDFRGTPIQDFCPHFLDGRNGDKNGKCVRKNCGWVHPSVKSLNKRLKKNGLDLAKLSANKNKHYCISYVTQNCQMDKHTGVCPNGPHFTPAQLFTYFLRNGYLTFNV